MDIVPSAWNTHRSAPGGAGRPPTVTLSAAHSPTRVGSGAALSLRAGAPTASASPSPSKAVDMGASGQSFLTRLYTASVRFDPAGASNPFGRSPSTVEQTVSVSPSTLYTPR